MKLIKQPWFLIFIFILSVYTYQFYNNPKLLNVSVTRAQANTKTSQENSTNKDKKLKTVNLTQEFSVKKVHSFSLSTYKIVDLVFKKHSAENIEVQLSGRGKDFKNAGEKLSDWFNVNLKKGHLKIKSPDKKGSFKGNLSLKELAKRFSGRDASDEKLKLTVFFPENHFFKKINLQGVSSDFKGRQLNFDKLFIASVSGDVRVSDSEGSFVEVETVSGDSRVEVGGLKRADFNSVSGDTTLTSLKGEPKIAFNSVSGDLTLNMPSDSQLDVSFNSMSGDLTNDFGLSAKATSHLKFSSMSGDAQVNKVTK